ncbi:MAG: DNA gyrase inhibitor YacG [Nitrospira sp.]
MTCPLCSQPAPWEGNPWRPFCSERCQLIDLGTWAAEQYRIPGPTSGQGNADPHKDEQ